MDSQITSLSCDKCSKVLKNKCALYYHNYYLHGDTIHRCTGCSYRTYDKRGLAQHVRTHTKDGIHVNCTGRGCKTCTRYTCTICKTQCLSPDTLATHLVIKHGVQTNETKVYRCSGCSYKTNVKSYLTHHIKTHTKDGMHVQCSRKGGKCKTCKHYTCTICKRQCLSSDTLARHLFIKHGVYTGKTKVYKCFGCSYKTIAKQSLTRHINTHTKDGMHVQCSAIGGKCKTCKQYNCTVCNKHCMSAATLARHIAACHNTVTDAGATKVKNVSHIEGTAESACKTRRQKKNISAQKEWVSFGCISCPENFKAKSTLYYHTLVTHKHHGIGMLTEAHQQVSPINPNCQISDNSIPNFQKDNTYWIHNYPSGNLGASGNQLIDSQIPRTVQHFDYHTQLPENNAIENNNSLIFPNPTLRSIDSDLSLLCNFLGNEFGRMTRI